MQVSRIPELFSQTTDHTLASESFVIDSIFFNTLLPGAYLLRGRGPVVSGLVSITPLMHRFPSV